MNTISKMKNSKFSLKKNITKLYKWLEYAHYPNDKIHSNRFPIINQINEVYNVPDDSAKRHVQNHYSTVDILKTNLTKNSA